MSIQQIEYLSPQKYARDLEASIMNQSDAYFNRKHYILGNGADKKEIQKALIYSEIMCSQECDIIRFIEDSIQGKLEQCGKRCKSNRLEDLLRHYKKEIKNCSDKKIINDCCQGEINW